MLTAVVHLLHERNERATLMTTHKSDRYYSMPRGNVVLGFVAFQLAKTSSISQRLSLHLFGVVESEQFYFLGGGRNAQLH